MPVCCSFKKLIIIYRSLRLDPPRNSRNPPATLEKPSSLCHVAQSVYSDSKHVSRRFCTVSDGSPPGIEKIDRISEGRAAKSGEPDMHQDMEGAHKNEGEVMLQFFRE